MKTTKEEQVYIEPENTNSLKNSSKEKQTNSWSVKEPSKEAIEKSIDSLIKQALEEDIATGDITALSCIPENSISKAALVLKEPALIAGLEIFKKLMHQLDPKIHFETAFKDGDYIQSEKECIAKLEGHSRALLAGERTALNIMQRMSGIATCTYKFVQKAKIHGIEILDTRKTTPLMRIIEKLAVKIGGGVNHRYGLYDRILIKDNHIAIAGGIKNAIERARLNYPQEPIEIEVTNLSQFNEALDLEVERIMLDNMTPELIQGCVNLANNSVYLEISGGVNANNLDSYLIEGINGISIGALTHSVKSIDISLEF